MRLLEISDGKFRLTKDFLPRETPEYAILSHTWGADTEEVTFRDVVDGTGERKTGWEKLKFCAGQAKRDGLRYFWVDTCCIDKSDNNELSRSINSMFRWYQNAARCYVYLSGISVSGGDSQGVQLRDIINRPIFRSHRWFTRGWTLQELVAPTSVEFFSEDGYRLGDKNSLEQQINDITGIAVSALRGTPLSEFGVEERFKWADTRDTTLEEDEAYCLLGVFGIFMPLIYGEGKAHATRRLRKEIADATSRSSGALGSQAKDAVWMVPFERNLHFTSRGVELRRLRQLLSFHHRTSKLAITGLGGVGKTQLALELLHLIKDEFPDCSIIWIPATSREALEQAYLKAAQKLGVPGCDGPMADVKGLLQTHLSGKSVGKWLLVFDNADDIDMWLEKADGDTRRLVDYLPKNDRGSIVFTTRNKKAAVAFAGPNLVQLSEMDEAGSRELLLNHLIDKSLDTPKDTPALLSRLTHLPLAIVQAAAYVNANGITLKEYLSLLDDQEEEIIDLLSQDFEDETRYPDVDNPVATTWLISFEQIRQRDPLAADYLCLMSCVEPKNIPQALLPAGSSKKKEIDALGTLQAYSFVTKGHTSCLALLAMHRLVHLATRNWLRKEGALTSWQQKAAARLTNMVGAVGYENTKTWTPCVPHMHHLITSSQTEEGEITRLLQVYGHCLIVSSRYREAATAYERVMDRQTRTHGPDHWITLVSKFYLAAAYHLLRQLEKSEGIYLSITEPLLASPNVHRDMKGILLSGFAGLLRDRGRYAEAEELYKQSYEMYKEAFGPEDSLTLDTLHSLALVYECAGRHSEAEELQVHVLEISQRQLGLDHYVTLIAMRDMARWCCNKGQWEKAERLLTHVVETCKLKYGEGDPDTLFYTSDLAGVWKSTGRLGEAIVTMQRCVDSLGQIMGLDNPDVVYQASMLQAWRREKEEALQMTGGG
ncbi:hypothetical protein B0T16DRAFT_460436 [Cercophora newfieldiana]|uniref:HET-domain-containing protein n=1 Tax=Cercophora newfieldiana TaxID=92897 RepID=A0AA40CPC3_9PEZI|nr:hypothetical protein B0T16DRAFT_460436 [Cercophora newfieldiana]